MEARALLLWRGVAGMEIELAEVKDADISDSLPLVVCESNAVQSPNEVGSSVMVSRRLFFRSWDSASSSMSASHKSLENRLSAA